VIWQAEKWRIGTVKKAKKVKRQPYYCEVRGSWVIPITRGRETLVDAEDVEFLGQFNWHWNPCRRVIGYAVLSGGQGTMHRILMNNPEDMCIDHINGNSLDNRKSNLRIVTNRENSQNKKEHRSGRLVGATFIKNRKKWMAQIWLGKTHKFLGRFKTEHEAHQAYMKAYNELITKEKSAA
jgi:hypothetical protein